jgi:hypothetical protein
MKRLLWRKKKVKHFIPLVLTKYFLCNISDGFGLETAFLPSFVLTLHVDWLIFCLWGRELSWSWLPLSEKVIHHIHIFHACRSLQFSCKVCRIGFLTLLLSFTLLWETLEERKQLKGRFLSHDFRFHGPLALLLWVWGEAEHHGTWQKMLVP